MPIDGPLLLITDPKGQLRTCYLEEASAWKLGRGESDAIVIEDDAASRRHAIIQRTETGELYLLDLGSRNGTFVNGQRMVTPSVLKDNDEICIGDYRFRFPKSHPCQHPGRRDALRRAGGRFQRHTRRFFRAAGRACWWWTSAVSRSSPNRSTKRALEIYSALVFRCLPEPFGTMVAGRPSISAMP